MSALKPPFWRITYRYEDDPHGDSFESRQTASEAVAYAQQIMGEPETYSKVRISWPHFPNEAPEGEGWVAVADLSPEQKRSLGLLLMPKENPQ